MRAEIFDIQTTAGEGVSDKGDEVVGCHALVGGERLLPVELGDVDNAVYEQLAAGGSHLGWAGAVTPLQEVAVAEDSGCGVSFAGGIAVHNLFSVDTVISWFDGV